MGHRFSREELYELVWSKPLRTIAASLGVSDVAVGKACRKADIPLPQRGYWAKKQVDKPTLERPVLPPRFPGASGKIDIGGTPRHVNGRELLEEPIPSLPVFTENLEKVRQRITTLLGKVTCPKLSAATHSAIATLLAQDDACRSEIEKTGYSWYAPQYDTPLERRRLRILNAIFLGVSHAGCRCYITSSRYSRGDTSISIRVGDVFISVELKPVGKKKPNQLRGRSTKDFLQFTIQKGAWASTDSLSWQDSEDLPLEKMVGMIATEVMMAGEVRHREWKIELYQSAMKSRAELEEKIRLEKIEAERQARELEERKAQQRIDRLLSAATAMQNAEMIRNFVAGIRGRVGDMKASPDAVEKWASWALSEADRIDPAKNLNFLNALDDD